MSKTVDMELKKAFSELHQMMLETTQKLRLIDMQMETLKRVKHRAELTSVEIKGLPNETKTYESVGRMFLYTPLPTVLENLNNKTSTCGDKIKTLEGNKSFLEKTLKESENNLREMVQQKKEQK